MDWRCGALVLFVIPAIAQLSELSFSNLKPDAVVAVGLTPGSIGTEDAVWIPQGDGFVRIDAKNNSPGKPIPVGGAPCASLVRDGDLLMAPLCDVGRLATLDSKQGNASSPTPLRVTGPGSTLAIAAQSVWAITDVKGVVTRVDHALHAAVAEVYVPARPFAVAEGEGALWVTSEAGDALTRINPQTNVIVETIKVGPRPGPLAVGEGSIWTLNRGDGSVSRVDPKTNKVLKTIAVGASVSDGRIAAGEGAVWISAPGMPLVRIDPRTDRVTHRFKGEGGGAILVAHGSVWVAAGPKTTWRIDPRLIAAMRAG